MPDLKSTRIGVVGLGYVGLPLAIEFGKQYPTIGLDIKRERIEELKAGHDATLEASSEELAEAKQLVFTCDPNDLADCNTYIVTVPTPIDAYKRPDLSLLERASETIGKLLKKGDVVIYESTVYPGATEEICVPVLEAESGLVFNVDFFGGYSPERINPGDKQHRITNILKITSGSTPETGDYVDALYRSIIKAGTHRASSLKVAEAAKVIENTQRDLNIALINELALIFRRLGIDTQEVLEAAGTKWNFLPFRPGLVGGHCIGVDPYYLTHKAEQIGFHPQMILAGRRINDGMAAFIAHDVIKTMLKRKQSLDGAHVLVMGFTFKENVPDTRNTKVVDLVRVLRDFVGEVVVYDPMADVDLARREYGIELTNALPDGLFDAIILAVKHAPIDEMGEAGVKALLTPGGLIYDLKGILPRGASHARI